MSWQPIETAPDEHQLVWVDVISSWKPSPWIATYDGGRFWNYHELGKDITNIVQRWADCSPPKPTHGGWLPIASAPEGKRILVSYLFHGQRKPGQVDIKEQVSGKFIWPSRYYEVTHWQPLPEPPK